MESVKSGYLRLCGTRKNCVFTTYFVIFNYTLILIKGGKMSEKENFYVPEGADEGRIENEEAAREVAELENTSRTREKELARQHEVGLTPEEERNLEVMSVLEERYPDAFEKVFYGEGNLAFTTYSTKKHKGEAGGSFSIMGNELLLTKRGVFIYDREFKDHVPELATAVDEKFGEDTKKEVINFSKADGNANRDVVQSVDLTNKFEREAVSKFLKASEKYHKEKEKEETPPEIEELVEGI